MNMLNYLLGGSKKKKPSKQAVLNRKVKKLAKKKKLYMTQAAINKANQELAKYNF